MKNELKKRIISSFFLLILLSICLYNKFFFISSIFVISILCWVEWIEICNKINWSNFKIKIFSLFFAIYLSFTVIVFYIVYSFNITFFISILMICIFSDIGGFVFGKIIGGKKLTKISPNKTISGSLGSFIMSYTVFYLYIHFFMDTLILSAGIMKIIFIPFIFSFLCQLGDLFISYFKRKAKLKNTSNMIPGHGGILDRVDGIIFSIPFGFIFLSFI